MSREPFIGAHKIVTTNGIFRPFALVDGRVVAVWGLSANTFTLKPLEKLKAPVIDALRKDAAALLEYLGHEGPCEIVVED